METEEKLKMENTALTGIVPIRFRWVEEAEYQMLKRWASIDGVTGLFNRWYFDQRLSAVSQKEFYSVIFLDVDDFKKVNDSFGHRIGDWVLLRIARLISSIVEQEAVPARTGGDEFCILLPEKNAVQAAQMAEEIRHAVQTERFSFNEGEHRAVSVSIGCASYPEHGNTPGDVLHAADRALYKAKDSGKNRVIVAEREEVCGKKG